VIKSYEKAFVLGSVKLMLLESNGELEDIVREAEELHRGWGCRIVKQVFEWF
jgi:hypothetical protein